VFTEVEKYLESAHEENQPQQFALDNRTASYIAIISAAIPAQIWDGTNKILATTRVQGNSKLNKHFPKPTENTISSQW
jgi:hypothetical protein